MKKIFLFPLNFKDKTQFVISQVSNLSDFIYITSNYCKIQDFKIKFYSNFKNSKLPFTYTLRSFATQILEENSSKRIISDIERYLLIFEIIKKNKEKMETQFSIEGLTFAVLNFIKELKIVCENELDIEKMKKEISSFVWKFEKGYNLLIFALDILKKYQEKIEKNNLIDQQDIYKEALKFIKDKSLKSIIFENILEIPPYQRNFVSEIIKNAENVVFSYFNPDDFSCDTKELIIEDTLNFIKGIEKWEEKKPKGEILNPKIECFNFPSKEEEIKGIVRLIEKEIKEKNNVSFDDFLITCPDILNYRPYIKRIFSRYKIPVEIIPGYSLIGESSISPIFEVFTFNQTYDWVNLMNILMSPYFKNIDKNRAYEFSKNTRERYKNLGFYKEDFFNIDDKNLKIIKKCLNMIKKDEMSLNKWGEILEKIIETLGWEPSDLEIKLKFEDILEKLKIPISCSQEEFLNIIRKLMEMVEVEEGKGEGIRVSGIIESLGIEKKICFFCGTTEENFPNAPKIEEFFIPEKIKKNLGLDYFEKRVARDRGDFYRIKNEHEKLIFTYPSKIEDRHQMKSLFIFDIEDNQIEEKSFSYISPEIFKLETNSKEIFEKYSEKGKFKISISDIETLLRCPLRFYLEKIKGIRPYEIPQIREIPEKWGEMVHKAVKETFEQEKNKVIEMGKIKEYKDKFECFLNKLINENFRKGEISSIYRNVIDIRKNEVMKKFENIIKNHVGKIFLDLEKEFEIEREMFILKGRIDIVEKDEDRINIIDIKTGTSEAPSYTEKDFFEKGKMQIPLYVWSYCLIHNLPYEKVKGVIWNFSFKEGEEKKLEKEYEFVRGNRNYLDKIEEYFNKKINEIKEGKIFLIPEECEYYCKFKELCPYER